MIRKEKGQSEGGDNLRRKLEEATRKSFEERYKKVVVGSPKKTIWHFWGTKRKIFNLKQISKSEGVVNWRGYGGLRGGIRGYRRGEGGTGKVRLGRGTGTNEKGWGKEREGRNIMCGD